MRASFPSSNICDPKASVGKTFNKGRINNCTIQNPTQKGLPQSIHGSVEAHTSEDGLLSPKQRQF